MTEVLIEAKWEELEEFEQEYVPTIEAKVLEFRNVIRDLQNIVEVTKEVKAGIQKCNDICSDCASTINEQKSKSQSDRGRRSNNGTV